ncbi:MAG TPA: serine/threonine-protein kinase, partial [Gemmataceae bacterium]|nr:serine/threonine-protein kinase [Gemmataceae bacterium]
RRAGYESLDILGTGLLGPVFKARQLALNRIVVLEMRATRTRLDPARLERLRADAEAVAQLHHPNIVELYDFGELNGEPFIAREHVEGGNLAQKVAGLLQSAEQTAILVETLARAVHHAHVQHIMHGNLKPSRVLLGDDGTCKITGFGLTEVLRAALHEGDGKPRATDRLAMPISAYTAPEQAENPAEDVSPSADVYALGAVLYELLTGRPPVRADSVDGLREQILLGKPEPPRLMRPEVPRELEAICLKCLERQPAARYPTTAALAEDLRRFGAGEVLFIDDLDDWAQQQRWARRAGYEILELLGQGPDGFTYKARQVALERTVVLERVTARHRFVPVAKSRFRWEARLLSRLRHANVVQLYDQGEQNDLAYFAREFVDGPTLAESAADAGPLASGHAQSIDEEQDRILEAAELVEMLARALHAAHAEGIIHGALNPGKVRITPGGVPKITSFRRVRLPGADAADLHPESDTHRVAGYLAPEQLEDRRRTSGPASDVYALGAILYTLLTGEPPFLGQTLQATIAQACAEAPVSPRLRQPSIPAELESICLKCLAKPPSARFATAGALADALRQASG